MIDGAANAAYAREQKKKSTGGKSRVIGTYNARI